MRQHLEIRLAQLAKEIAASKTPKIDAAANALFDQIGRKHEHKAPSDWARKINGAAGAPASATCETGNRSVGLGAAPPSAQKFKVGDRVRTIWGDKHWQDLMVTGFSDRMVVVVSLNPNETGLSSTTDDLGRKVGSFYERNLELIPAPEPAATPVALGDGWIEWKGGECPIPGAAAGTYALRFSDGDELVSNLQVGWWANLWSKETTVEKYWIVAYRVFS